MSFFTETLSHWQQEPTALTRPSWQNFVQQIAPINFVSGTVLIDTALWGGFWQGDVIAPGYSLPLLELVYLRNTRLEESFTFATPQAFLQALQSEIRDFPAGLWTTTLLNKPALCIQQSRFIIWLVEAGFAGAYANKFSSAAVFNLIPLITPPANKQLPQANAYYEDYLADFPNHLLGWQDEWATMNTPARLDCLIQAHRAIQRF